MKIICVGRNYTDHIKELENQRPESPVLFHKPDSSIILKNKPFFIPDFSNEIHYEIELNQDLKAGRDRNLHLLLYLLRR